MADETPVKAESANTAADRAGTDTPAKTAEAVVETAVKAAEAVAKAPAKATKPAEKNSTVSKPAAPSRRAKRPTKAAKPVRTTARRAKAPRRKKPSVAAKPAVAARNERTQDVTFDFNTLFSGFPTAAAPFQNLFTEAGERSQEAVRRTQKVAEELADLTRANVEALVDASRIAVEGARSIGQDVVANSRQNVEQAAEAVRSLAEAKSPTEFLQLQGEFARSSFDRLIAESSKLTESVVKLAGETVQPLSNRASVNAERFNQLVA